ncbi:excinuclease ABC subunit UvrC [Desulfothermobacter acidiphilus]|uniref:excinuclease ABC subunit UvrC n=1 Tax=Desulfothermobacter acidiphilus TaxID=1938353 RepID=UPI003F8BBDB7
MSKELMHKAQKLPAEPGVYLFKDGEGRVLYVGKAACLRQRVKSYFQAHPSPKVEAILRRASELDFVLTGNEVEALILEANLIKRYRPRYNVVLKDDKSYPYIKVTVGEDYPRVLFARRRDDPTARYFGPYTRSGAVYETLRFLRTLFPYRSCSGIVPRPNSRPCLNYHIKRCPGPCTGAVDPEEYRRNIEALCLFLDGRYRQVIRRLQQEMRRAARELAFERAALFRDRLEALELVLKRQRVVAPRAEDLDVVAVARQGDRAQAVVLLVREGRLVGQESLALSAATAEEVELLTEFLKQYYGVIASSFPRQLVLPCFPEEDLTELWRSRSGHEVKVLVPRRGYKKELEELAVKNAWAALNEEVLEAEARTQSLVELAGALGLARVPYRIEGYDVSHLQGVAPVAVMVVFVGGKPHKSSYRRFALIASGHPDDYRALRDTFRRRFTRARQEEEALAQGKLSPSQAKFLPLPDLVLVDGGAGQAGVAREVLDELGFYDLPVFGLAKEEEKLYLPHRAADPIVLPRRSPALHLLQRVRDEAHRFALGFHRRKCERESLRSQLADIEGIGPTRLSALLRAFPSLEVLRAAGVEELARVPGMNRPAAEAVYRYFHEGESNDQADRC